MNDSAFYNVLRFLGNFVEQLLNFNFPGTQVEIWKILVALVFLPLIIRAIVTLFDVPETKSINTGGKSR